MYTAISILIVLVCVLLALVVLIQNPKGGGISSGIIGSNQIMGVQKTSDFIEKLTWGLAISLVVLCLAASFSLPNKENRSIGTSMQEQIDKGSGTSPDNPMPAAQPAPQPGQAPAEPGK